jgi:hypothetical protein
MRRIPQAGNNGWLIRQTRPTRETFLNVVDQTPKPLEKSRFSRTWGIARHALIKNLSVYRMAWRAGCCYA